MTGCHWLGVLPEPRYLQASSHIPACSQTSKILKQQQTKNEMLLSPSVCFGSEKKNVLFLKPQI